MTCPRRRCVRHGSLLKISPTRAAFARPGPSCQQVPRRQSSYAALRLPHLHRPRLRFPLSTAYLDAGACSEPAVHAPANTQRVGDGSPALRKTGFVRGEGRTSRVTGSSSSCVPWCNTPPDATSPCPYPSSRRSAERPPLPSGDTEPSASGMNVVFEAKYPRPTRSRAYASPASLPRPSPGSLPARAGSPLAGRVSHPLDDESKFHGVIAYPPIPIDQQSLVALNVLSAFTAER